MEMMMMLGGDALNNLRMEFLTRHTKDPDGFSLDEFVALMLEKLEPPDGDTVKFTTELCELFAQIDINGDGTMEWEEFTSYCVEAGIVATRRVNVPLRYKFVEATNYVDRTSRGPAIWKLFWIPPLKRLVVFEAESNKVRLYNSRLELTNEIVMPESEVAVVVSNGCYVPDHNLIAVCSTNAQITLWDAKTLQLTGTAFTRTAQSCVAWARDRLFSVGSSSKSISAWKYPGYALDKRFGKHSDIVTDMVALLRYDVLVSASLDKKVMLWDLDDLSHKGTMIGHARGIRQLVWIKSQDLLISAGFDCDALGWDIPNRRQVLRLRGHRFPLVGVQELKRAGSALSRALTGDRGGNFKVWDVARSHTGLAVVLQTFTAASDLSKFTPRAFATMMPTGNMVAAGIKMHLFVSKPVVSGEAAPVAAVYNPTVKKFVTVANKGIRLYNEYSNLEHELYECVDSPVTVVRMDDRQRKLIMGLQSGQIAVCNFINGALMKYCDSPHSSDVTSLVYVDQDKIVVSASWDRSVRVWDENDPDELVLLRTISHAHGADVTALDASHSLALLASGAADFTLYVWDYLNLKLDGACKGHTAEITCVKFVEPYPLLVSADAAGCLKVWGTRFGNLDNKYRCVFSAVNTAPAEEWASTTFLTATGEEPEGDIVVPITQISLAADMENNLALLVTADERGEVKTWNLTPMLVSLGIEPVPESRKPSNRMNYNPHLRTTRYGPGRPRRTSSSGSRPSSAGSALGRSDDGHGGAKSTTGGTGGGGGSGLGATSSTLGSKGGDAAGGAEATDDLAKRRLSAAKAHMLPPEVAARKAQAREKLKTADKARRKLSTPDVAEMYGEIGRRLSQAGNMRDHAAAAKAAVAAAGGKEGDGGGFGGSASGSDGEGDGYSSGEGDIGADPKLKRAKVGGGSRRSLGSRASGMSEAKGSAAADGGAEGDVDDGDGSAKGVEGFDVADMDNLESVSDAGRGGTESRGRHASRATSFMLAPSGARSMSATSMVSGDGSVALPLLYKFKAHSDAIETMQVVMDPRAVITCSIDKSVRVWSLQGEPLGVLWMGKELTAKTRAGDIDRVPWKFAVDEAAREKARVDEAEAVLDLIDKEHEEERLRKLEMSMREQEQLEWEREHELESREARRRASVLAPAGAGAPKIDTRAPATPSAAKARRGRLLSPTSEVGSIDDFVTSGAGGRRSSRNSDIESRLGGAGEDKAGAEAGRQKGKFSRQERANVLAEVAPPSFSDSDDDIVVDDKDDALSVASKGGSAEDAFERGKPDKGAAAAREVQLAALVASGKRKPLDARYTSLQAENGRKKATTGMARRKVDTTPSSFLADKLALTEELGWAPPRRHRAGDNLRRIKHHGAVAGALGPAGDDTRPSTAGASLFGAHQHEQQHQRPPPSVGYFSVPATAQSGASSQGKPSVLSSVFAPTPKTGVSRRRPPRPRTSDSYGPGGALGLPPGMGVSGAGGEAPSTAPALGGADGGPRRLAPISAPAGGAIGGVTTGHDDGGIAVSHAIARVANRAGVDIDLDSPTVTALRRRLPGEDPALDRALQSMTRASRGDAFLAHVNAVIGGSAEPPEMALARAQAGSRGSDGSAGGMTHSASAPAGVSVEPGVAVLGGGKGGGGGGMSATQRPAARPNLHLRTTGGSFEVTTPYGAPLSATMTRAREKLSEALLDDDEEGMYSPNLHRKATQRTQPTRTRGGGRDFLRSSPDGVAGRKQQTFGAYTLTDLMELKDLFDSFDVDGSGAIDIKEFAESTTLKSSSFPSLAGSMFESIDADGSGEITLDELVRVVFPLASEKDIDDMVAYATRKKATTTSSGPRKLPKEKQDELRAIFALYDVKGTGEVTIDELWAAMAPNWGELITRADLRRMCIDHNISLHKPLVYEDFVTLLKDSLV